MFLSLGRLGAAGIACKTVSSSTYARSVTDKWTPVKEGVNSPGYDCNCNCWMPGFKPYQWALLGITPKSGPYYKPGTAWPVCVPQTAPAPKCPTCPSAPRCPTCPPPLPPCPPAATCPECPTLPVEDTSTLGKYGPALGFLLAATILGGGGYYAYRKLGKKKKR